MEQQPLIYKKECFEIIGAAMEVHNVLGCGFKETVYQEAFEKELKLRGIQFFRECPLSVYYKGELLRTDFRPDFICYDKIIVELKAVKELDDVHRSQAINYAKIAGFRLSLLINFGESSLAKERFPIG